MLLHLAPIRFDFFRICSVTIGLLGLLGGGCQSVDERIKQHPDVFQELSAAEQERLRDRIVKLGDSPELVMIAFGKPDKEERVITSNGRERVVWTYHGRHHMKTGSRLESPIYGTVPVVHDYKVIDFVLAQVTFLDGEVVNLRNPAAEAEDLDAVIQSMPAPTGHTTVDGP